MDPFRTKRPVYILLAVCLVLTAVSLSLIYWVSNNLQAATRLSATGLASDGAGYSLMADEAGETYVLGDYTTRVGFDGITLMSARGDERAHYETDMLGPYVLQDNDTLVVGSAEGSDVFVLNQDGSYFRPAITGAVSSAVCQDGRLLVIAARPGGRTMLTETELATNEMSELYSFPAGLEPMRARYTPQANTIDVLVQPVYAGETGTKLIRLTKAGEIVSEQRAPADDWFADFIYVSDGRMAVLGASSVWLTDMMSDAAGKRFDLPGAAGLWQADSRLIALAESEGDKYALYELTDAAAPLVQLETRPLIMPAVSDTYAVVVTGDTLQLIDIRGARQIDAFPLTQTVHRVEFTGPTSFLVIADYGVYPFAVQ